MVFKSENVFLKVKMCLLKSENVEKRIFRKGKSRT